MANMTNMILGRHLDGENTAQILNIARVTLANPASSAEEVMRKQEFDVGFNQLDVRLAAIEGSTAHLSTVYVDTTSLNLAQALNGGTYNGNGTWTFGGRVMDEGDLLILNAATEQDEARSWVLNGGTSGTAADFTALSTDVDAAIQAAAAAVVGGASNAYNTLGKVEAVVVDQGTRLLDAENEIDVLQAQMGARAETREFNGTFTSNGDGTFTATFANSFNTPSLNIQVMRDVGSGVWEHLGDSELTIGASTTQVLINTASATVGGYTIKVVATGVQA